MQYDLVNEVRIERRAKSEECEEAKLAKSQRCTAIYIQTKPQKPIDEKNNCSQTT